MKISSRKLLFVLFTIICTSFSWAQRPDYYQLFIDLNLVKDDMVKVDMIVPEVKSDSIEFQMPKIVPGTYAIYDFGRFIEDVRAMTRSGQKLEVERLTDNRWLIKNAKELYRITYWVNDTYDTDKDNVIFEPAGTNIEDEKNFVINTFTVFGYLEGMQEYDFLLNVQRPKEFYGVTALPRVKTMGTNDVFRADDYFHLHDSPLMYNVPDTASLMVANTKVIVSVYSPNNVVTADEVMEAAEETLIAQKKFMGDTLPVDKYAILIHLNPGQSLSGGMGALEHSQSTMFNLPEFNNEYFFQTIRDVTAHEFFHIVTPLTIHSEQIHDYDFINPKMSKHLWLYEGLTEYHAQLVQVQYDLMEEEKFLSVMREKMNYAERFDNEVSFTEFSKKVLDEYEDDYINVYQKGALIGMCLDILLRDLSDGQMGTPEMMMRLSEKFGRDKYFKDDSLFYEIKDVTYEEVYDFLETYVAGTEPLPYEEYLKKVGVLYKEEINDKQLSIGNVSFSYNAETKRIVFRNTDSANVFGQDMGYQDGDEWVMFNGDSISIENYSEVFQKFRETREPGDKIVAVVARPKEKKGETVYKIKKLKAKAVEVEVTRENVLEFMPEPTEEQKKLRKAWLNN